MRLAGVYASSFSRSAATRFAMGTRTCSMLSRSRMVTAAVGDARLESSVGLPAMADIVHDNRFGL